MSRARAIYHMARADFRERVRRYSFLVTLAFTVYVGLATATGKLLLSLGEYRGILNSAWIGSLMALVSCMLLSLVGFYIVRNSVERDQQTRVGRILAATPMTKTGYTLAKSISNFAVLAAMVAVMALAALVFQAMRGESRHIELWPLLSPFVFIALPCMALTAAVAVFFETTPVLRTGAGNVIYPVAWSTSIAVVQFGRIDPTGMGVFFHQMTSAVRAIDPTFKQSFALQINIGQAMPPKTFVWSGLHWSMALVAERLLWVLVAVGVALLAAVMFHRFDPARERLRIRARRESEATSDEASAAVAPAAAHLSPLSAARRDSRMTQLFASELRLLLRKRWWWYAISLGFVVAGFATPLPVARFGVLVAAWLWPVLVWSQLGAREELFSTTALIFSSAHAMGRQLSAGWLAGAIVPLLLSSGVLLRLLLGSDLKAASSIIAGSLFVPALALACGTMTGNSRLFEAIYTVWWYVGPAHAVPGLDFIGVTDASARPALYLVVTAVALTTAFAARRLRLARA
ncbi:MAG: hypothetical protein LAO31_20155 [Acidobacteriia bacterium]|nr:hypothetical protein [Terriglobia bacterium]